MLQRNFTDKGKVYHKCVFVVLLLVVVCVDVSWCSEILDGNVVLVSGARVTSVIMTSHRRSRITCTSACLNENAAGHVCMTATYDRQSGQCELSTDPQREMTFTGDGRYVGIVVTKYLVNLQPTTTTLTAPSGGSNANTQTQFGRSFLFAFTQTYDASSPRVPYVEIMSQETTEVQIRYLGFTVTIQLVGATVVEYQFDMSVAPLTTKGTTLILQTGAEISSDKDVAVFAFSRHSSSGDGSVIVPEAGLGTSYILHGLCSGGTEVVVTGVTDGTDVTVKRPGDPIDPAITLNRRDVLKMTGCDLVPSGALITSSFPVAVQMGSHCQMVPNLQTKYCDHLMTSLPPVDKLQKTFIVPEMYPRADFSIGLVSPHDATTVDIYDAYSTLLQTLTMNRQDSQFLQFSETLVIESSQPLLVVQYGHGSDLTLGDPSLTVIPPPEHFTNVYRFTVPTWYSAPSYACAIILSDHASDVRVNQVSVVSSASRNVTIPDTGETYQVLYFPLTVHGVAVLLDHADPNVNFAAFVYARTVSEEYATVLGFNF